MRNSVNLRGLNLVVTAAVILVTIGGLIYLSGCAPTAQQTTIDPERAKAIEDSLQRAYIFELNKAWSTGYEYYKPKIYNRAIKPFWKVIELDTIDRFKDVYSLLSDSYFKLGEIDSAQLVLEQGLEKYPENVGMRRNYAYILANREQIDDAILEYEQVVEEDDSQINDWKQLANLYIRNNQPEDAIGAYQKVIALDPADKDAQQTLGQLLKSSGDEDAAVEALENALKLDPNNIQLLFDLGKSYYNQGEYAKSVEKFQSYLAKNPDDMIAMEYLGGSFYGLGRYNESITTYKKIIEAVPDNKKVYTDIATNYKEMKQFSTARNYVRRALEIDSNYGLAYIVLGEIYEASVDHCMDQKGRTSPKFDDKLVFREAYRQYQRAARDIQFQDIAERRMSYLKDFLPSTQDEFFNKSRKSGNGYRVDEDCYKWIASVI
ncbi:tetratricopeptide repeat protein [candidate division KSB1 bacterium]|nr:tetratricopeptide repeat protein [candidate division KSB1 bacterium]